MNEVAVEQTRIAQTESLFRDVNERVQEINDRFGTTPSLSEWICECSDATCTHRMELTQAEYETVRANSRRFAVAPSDDHVDPRLERVVERNDRYWVIEKFEVAGEVAAKLDRRDAGQAAKESERSACEP